MPARETKARVGAAAPWRRFIRAVSDGAFSTGPVAEVLSNAGGVPT